VVRIKQDQVVILTTRYGFRSFKQDFAKKEWHPLEEGRADLLRSYLHSKPQFVGLCLSQIHVMRVPLTSDQEYQAEPSNGIKS
jgi:hypothetical protein